jgi:hypothetical protein
MATFGNTGGRPDQWLSTFEWAVSKNLPNDSWVTSRASRYGVYDRVGRAGVVHAAYWAQVLRGGQSSILKIVAQMDEFFAFDRQAREQGLTDRDREVLHSAKSQVAARTCTNHRVPHRLEVGSAILTENGTNAYTRDEIARHCHNKQFKSHTK